MIVFKMSTSEGFKRKVNKLCFDSQEKAENLKI